ncbi:MAG: hypothetical protein FJ382_11390 [Verrucomicrobia bacterium]|nr:hypothetical protein [Verrucomicrobiota bacterium]
MSSPTDPSLPSDPLETQPSGPSLWTKLADQLPAVILTVVIIGGIAYWMHTRTLAETAASQQAELARLRDQTNAEIKAAAEENRRQIESVNTLLKDAIAKRSAEVFMTDDEVNRLNQERVNQLAQAIAAKIQPFTPLPTTPEDAERQQTEQVNKVGDRLSQRIQPILAQMAADQNLTRESINGYSQKISDQIGVVLTTELAKNQQLNNNLAATQSIARESLALSQEVTALYLSSFKDQGVLTRLLTLPANVVRDVSKLSIVNSAERKQIEEDLVRRMNAIDQRLKEIGAAQPTK